MGVVPLIIAAEAEGVVKENCPENFSTCSRFSGLPSFWLP
ncbi:hypothetical protein VL20_6413 [Microcystis panniformis FACHB-1757]|uniref:Uncharacterized protein n=1 Tax=Microcystis panniformis FACHB-1757 TaxID=1638788 RepID=A0A0K1SAK4_9CHRO|nr:hypothetical protein VL20_6413 [Microcystis panniformis FACHB-1757]